MKRPEPRLRRRTRLLTAVRPSARFPTIVAAYLVVTSGLAITTARVLHTRAGPAPLSFQQPVGSASATAKYLVLMVLDGARPDYFGVSSLPHLNQLMASETRFSNAFDGILEAETPSGHATIATGSRPDTNGILGFDWANDNDRYSLLSPDKMVNVLQILQDSHAPTLAGLLKTKYPADKVVALSGHKYYVAAPLGGPQADAILYFQGDLQGHYVPVAVPGHVPPQSVLNTPGLNYPSIKLANGVEDRLTTHLALATFSHMRPTMMLINYPEFDWPLGHVYGGSLDPATVATDMRVFDADLGRIEEAYRKAGILDKTLFVVTADHGMMPIGRFVPASVISDAITRAGATAPDIAASSADYIWLADATKAKAVADNVMSARDPGIQSVYYLSNSATGPRYTAVAGAELAAADEAANQYLLGALLNGHQPTVVVFGREGVSFSDPKTNWKADHGGNSWQSQNIPLVIAGPGIIPGAVNSAAVQLSDIAPTVLTAMGVSPTGMTGHVLTDALISSTAGAAAARKEEIRQLRPIEVRLRLGK